MKNQKTTLDIEMEDISDVHSAKELDFTVKKLRDFHDSRGEVTVENPKRQRSFIHRCLNIILPIFWAFWIVLSIWVQDPRELSVGLVFVFLMYLIELIGGVFTGKIVYELFDLTNELRGHLKEVLEKWKSSIQERAEMLQTILGLEEELAIYKKTKVGKKVKITK